MGLENRPTDFDENGQVLLDAVYNEPNAETISAYEESRKGKYAGTIDTTSVEAMTKSILG